MRLHALHLLVLAVLAVVVAAWTKEDHEIFRLREEVAAAEGPNVTFYDVLGVKPSASHADIVKAYRKQSKLLHPDKAKRSFMASRAKPPRSAGSGQRPGVHVARPPSEREIQAFMKRANERYARLAVIAEILKGPARDRYDHFLRHGFPRWKGTGYYYSRFRPGLGSVLVGLFLVFGGVAHYAALVLSWKRQVEFVDRYIRHARRAAWGDELGIQGLGGLDGAGAGAGASSGPRPDDGPAAADDNRPVVMNRRQKRLMEKESRREKKTARANNPRGSPADSSSSTAAAVTTPAGDRKRVVAENGKVLIVDAVGNVFLEEETDDGEKQEFLLDVDEIPRPTVRDTMVYRLPAWVVRTLAARLRGGGGRGAASSSTGSSSTPVDDDEQEGTGSDDHHDRHNIPTPPLSSGGESRRRKSRRR